MIVPELPMIEDEEAIPKPPDAVPHVPSDNRVTKKPRSKGLLLAESEEDGVVDFVRENEILYNRRLKDYKDTGKKKALWEQKAGEMGVDGEHNYCI